MGKLALTTCMILALALCTLSAVGGTRIDRSAIEVAALTVEDQVAPMGIDVSSPRLSWRFAPGRHPSLQYAYEIRVFESAGPIAAASPVWDSGRIESHESINQPYAGPPLKSRAIYRWQVRVWDQAGLASAWSSMGQWEMGLLSQADWGARWIGGLGTDQIPLLRREFVLKAGIVKARLYATSHGLYQIYLNGNRVGNAEFTPGFTSYHRRLQYQTYEITDLLTPGPNAIGALLGPGWYVGKVGIGDEWGSKPHAYGDRMLLFAQVEVTYADGSVDRLVTDQSWKASKSPITLSGIYEGESYDARLEQARWDRSGFNDSDWRHADEFNEPTSELVAQSGPVVKEFEEIAPQSVTMRPNGEVILDMGRNMVGRMRFSVRGKAGITLSLRHGEILDSKGDLYTDNLLHAAQTVRYTLRGGATELFEPHFSYQGFRYVAVSGYPAPLRKEAFRGIVLHSATPFIGEFRTSNADLNRLQQNILWSQKGNFFTIPTDCPQRDERMGWTGDIQIFAATAAFNADVEPMLERWLKDLSADQRSSGSVPFVIPNVHDVVTRSPISSVRDFAGAAGWGDAATVVPWSLYVAYDDRRVLENQYESMVKWVGYEKSRAGPALIWKGDFQWGDWLGMGGERTDDALIATAYFAHSTDLLSRAAKVLGNTSEAQQYSQLFDEIRTAFRRTFVNQNTVVGTGTQTAYVLALNFGLLRDDQVAAAARHLVERVHADGHLTTGFLGTAGLLFALSNNGYFEDAYELLLNKNPPSWLYPITKGATTMWESWDGIRPDGSLQNPDVNSFNHYALGAVGSWMYRVIAGIRPDESAPGYRHIIFAPHPGGGLRYATAFLMTPYGRAGVFWQTIGSRLSLSIEIPPNTTATVEIPANSVSINGRRVRVSDTHKLDLSAGRFHLGYLNAPATNVLEKASKASVGDFRKAEAVSGVFRPVLGE